MAQGVFDALGRVVRGFGEGTEGSNVGKIAVAEFSDVVPGHIPVHDGLGGLHRIGLQLEAGSEIVGGTAGNIAHRCVAAAGEKAVYGLVEGAVAAGADHQIHLGCLFCHDLYAVAGAGGHVGDDFVVCPVEDGDDVRQGFGTFAHAGIGVHHKQ